MCMKKKVTGLMCQIWMQRNDETGQREKSKEEEEEEEPNLHSAHVTCVSGARVLNVLGFSFRVGFKYQSFFLHLCTASF